MSTKMQIDIWSDIMCPFCYIGKRKLEGALEKFEHKDNIAINWHSFQLDPSMESQPGKNIYDYLAERKGQTREWSIQMHKQVVDMAREAGLEYNFDKAVIANSFDAHRLIQLAKKHGKGDAAEESLFKAYFTEGKDMGNHETLVQIGEEIGLDATEIKEALQGNAYAAEVKKDIEQASAIGVRGVPFFVMDNKYAVSGAQQVETFLQALEKSWKEYEKEHPVIASFAEGAVCTPEGECTPS